MSDPFSRLFRTTDDAARPRFNASPARGSISEQVAHRIMGLVKSGDLKARDRLPTESQMALALGIGRPALREALKALTMMGVLESRQGGRYTVTDLSPLRLIEPFNVLLSGKRYDPAQHYEARNAVDLECVRLCAERALPERRAEILRLAAEGPSLIGKPVAFRVLDRQFHFALYAGSGNDFLEILARGLFTIGLELRLATALERDVVQRSCEQHARVAEAIAAGDGEAAVEAYHDHLVHIRESTIQVLATPPDESAP